MLLRLYRDQNIPAIFIIILTAILLWAIPLLSPHLSTYDFSAGVMMPLYILLTKIVGGSKLAGIVVSFALAGTVSVMMVWFNTSAFFLRERTFLPAVIYLMLSSLIIDLQQLNPALPASVLLLLALVRIMDSYRKNGLANNYFDAGLLIGTGTLFYNGLLWFGVLLFIGIALVRTFSIREILFSVAGLATPFLITGGIYYLTGVNDNFFNELIAGFTYENNQTFDLPWFELALCGLTGFLTLVSSVFLFSLMDGKKIKSRKTFYLLLWVMVISVLVYFAVPSVSVEMLWISAIPAAYLLTHYFIFARSRMVKGMIFSGLLLLLIGKQILWLF